MPVTVQPDVNVAHNYSTQTLNSTEQAKEKLRNELSKVGMRCLVADDKISLEFVAVTFKILI